MEAASDEALRQRAEQKQLAAFAKLLPVRGLALTGLGDTLKALLVAR